MDPDALAELLSCGADHVHVSVSDLVAATQDAHTGHTGVSDDADLLRRLCIASERGHVVVGRLLLLLAPDVVNGRNTRGLTPLLLAATQGHEPTARLLLANGALPNIAASDGTGRTAMHAAAKRGDAALTRLLLDATADVRARMRHRRPSMPSDAAYQWLTPLQVACLHGKASVAPLLLPRCSQHDAPSIAGDGSCSNAAVATESSHRQLVGGEPRELDRALHCAAHAGDAASVQLLLLAAGDDGAAAASSLDAAGAASASSLGGGVLDVPDDLLAPRWLGRGVMAIRGPPLLSSLLNCVAASPKRPVAPAVMEKHLGVARVLLDARASPDAQCTVLREERQEDAEAPKGAAEAKRGVGASQGAPRPPLQRTERPSMLEVCCMAGAAEAVQLLLRRGAAAASGLGATPAAGVGADGGPVRSAAERAASTAETHGHAECAALVRSCLVDRANAAMRELLEEDEAAADGSRRAVAAADAPGTEAPNKPRRAAEDVPAGLVEFWTCPLTCAIFRDPVVALDGLTYERYAIEEWLSERLASPLTGQPLSSAAVVPNIVLRNQIERFAAPRP